MKVKWIESYYQHARMYEYVMFFNGHYQAFSQGEKITPEEKKELEKYYLEYLTPLLHCTHASAPKHHKNLCKPETSG